MMSLLATKHTTHSKKGECECNVDRHSAQDIAAEMTHTHTRAYLCETGRIAADHRRLKQRFAHADALGRDDHLKVLGGERARRGGGGVGLADAARGGNREEGEERQRERETESESEQKIEQRKQQSKESRESKRWETQRGIVM